MENPRSEKVAVVDEVRDRLGASSASVVTEYRGLTVADLAALRHSLVAAGGDYKIFKNTLVRLAVTGSPHEPLADLLSGPTAITFVRGDVSAVAKALRDFSRNNPHLILKGGMMEGAVLSPSDLASIADLPSREVLLARLAGAIAAPIRQMASLIKAVPQNLAYGLSALVEERRAAEPEAAGSVGPEAAEVAAPVTEAPAEPPEAEATETTEADATTAEATETTDVDATTAEASEAVAAEVPVEAAPATPTEADGGEADAPAT